MKSHRPITKLALACLLFLVVALGDTPALAAQRVEAPPPTHSRQLNWSLHLKLIPESFLWRFTCASARGILWAEQRPKRRRT